jgi:hypothetical protein
VDAKIKSKVDRERRKKKRMGHIMRITKKCVVTNFSSLGAEKG